MKRLKLDIQKFADGKVIIQAELGTKSFDAQIKKLEDELDTLNQEFEVASKYDMPEEEMLKYAEQIEKTRNQLTDLYKKQNDLAKNNDLNNIGNSMESIIKKVTRWGLAIFSVRSAYMFIRQSVSTLSETDEELATDIEYIRWALATTIKPVIEWIVNAVYTVLGFIGSLIKSLFNVNIFANASADAFKKSKDSLSSSNKEAKKLQKTLAGFDEMNILNEDGGTTFGGGGGGTPSFSFTDLVKENEGLKNFWKEIFDFWEKDWKKVFNNVGGKWGTFIQGLILSVKGFWDILKGTGEIITGVVQIVVGLVTGNFELVQKGFNNLIKGIKDVFMGIIELITGVLLTVLGFIKGIFLEIWNVFYSYIIKPITSVLYNASKFVNEKVQAVYDGVSEIFKGLINVLKAPFEGLISFIGGLWNKVKKPLEDFVKNINKTVSKINPINLVSDLGKNAAKGIRSLFGFSKGGVVVPKLASGGIINNPGRGVPIGQAIGGEKSMEGVIPLTDSQMMSLLGETIGRYITVNLTNITKLNGRQIARKVDKVNQSNDFVFNR